MRKREREKLVHYAFNGNARLNYVRCNHVKLSFHTRALSFSVSIFLPLLASLSLAHDIFFMQTHTALIRAQKIYSALAFNYEID